MKRRDFIMLLGGVGVPLTAVRKVGAQLVGGPPVCVGPGPANCRALDCLLRRASQGRLPRGSESDGRRRLQYATRPCRSRSATMMVNARPDAIMTAVSVDQEYCSARPETIPIVTVSDDLLAEKVVTSLSHPDGNATGISILATELDGKRQEILLDDNSGYASAGDPRGFWRNYTGTNQSARRMPPSARDIVVSTHIANRADDIMPAIDATLNGGAQALNVLASSLFNRYRETDYRKTSGGAAARNFSVARNSRRGRPAGLWTAFRGHFIASKHCRRPRC